MSNFKKINLLFVLATLVSGKALSQKSTEKESDVPYVIAERYYVNNSVKNGTLQLSKITKKAEFDSYFSAAPTGTEGQTKIDFSKQFVIAVIEEESTNQIAFNINHLVTDSKSIRLDYSTKIESEHPSYTSRHLLILVVDKKYEKEVKIVSSKDEKEGIEFKIADRYFVKNTLDKDLKIQLKITSEEEFQAYFGAATVMGENGSPTVIDFDKQFVLIHIEPTSTSRFEFSEIGLTNEDGTLTFSYTINETKTEANSTFYRYSLIVLVDKTNKGEIKYSSKTINK